jgi:putative endonuclease
MSAIDSGANAESLAADFLVARGLAIVARNFRTRLGEIDVIARERETLVFVEADDRMPVRGRQDPRLRQRRIGQ